MRNRLTILFKELFYSLFPFLIPQLTQSLKPYQFFTPPPQAAVETSSPEPPRTASTPPATGARRTNSMTPTRTPGPQKSRPPSTSRPSSRSSTDASPKTRSKMKTRSSSRASADFVPRIRRKWNWRKWDNDLKKEEGSSKEVWVLFHKTLFKQDTVLPYSLALAGMPVVNFTTL